jgi:hypothetical protein
LQDRPIGISKGLLAKDEIVLAENFGEWIVVLEELIGESE